jgi:hypothetical protein
MLFKEKIFNNWGDYKIFVDNCLPQWIYRGQSSSNWELSSSIERSNLQSGVENPHSLENQVIEEFQRVVCHYLPAHLIPTNKTEWLALIQHYGTPTRLIDFTKSPYIAAYFAFENEVNNDDNVAIWVVDKTMVYQKAYYFLSNKFSSKDIFADELSSSLYTFSSRIFELIFDKPNLDCIVPLEAFSKNERYYFQQSIFLTQCNPEKRFQDQLEFLGESLSQAIMKIILPFSLRNEVLRDLNKMNIKRANLFPGLDGFAKTINIEYSTLSKFIDQAKSQKYLRENDFI